LDRYSDKPSYKIGLFLQEEIVSVYDDSSLFDNAQGTTNYNSPGADRYKVNLLFTTIPYDENLTDKFIQLLGVKDGVEELIDRDNGMFNWMEILARRTYDESGHYTVTPFGLDVREYFNKFTNRGVINIRDITFSDSIKAEDFVIDNFRDTKMFDTVNEIPLIHTVSFQDIINYPDQELVMDNTLFYPGRNHDEMMEVFSDYLSLGIERGNAYVFGWNIRSRNTKYIPYKRALESFQRNNEYINTGLGTYIYISDVGGAPSVGSVVNFYNTPIYSENCVFGVSKSSHDDFVINTAAINMATTHTNTDEPDDSEWWDSVYNTTDLGSGGSANTNTLGVRLVATARVKGFEYVTNSGPINNGLNEIQVRPKLTGTTRSAIFKLFFYDIKYENGYSSEHIRSVSSRTSITNTWEFSASTLISYRIATTGVGSIDMENKSLAYVKFQLTRKTVGLVYFSENGHIIIKHLGSSGEAISGVSVNTNTFQIQDQLGSGVAFDTTGGLTGDWSDGSETVDTLNTTNTGGVIENKTIIGVDGNGSLVPLENNFIKTVRHVDDVTGTISIDTSYKFHRLYKSQTVTGGSPPHITIELNPTAFEKFMAFDERYYFSYISSATALTGGVHELLVSDLIFEDNYRKLTVSSDIFLGLSVVDIYIPIIKTEAIEKLKTKIYNKIELPYTLISNSGEELTEPSDVGDVTYETSNFSTDMIGSNSITYISNGIMQDNVTESNNEFIYEYTMKKVQLKSSDICEVDRIYDTGLIENIQYRVDLDGGVEFIHNMSVTQLQYISDAFSYFERTQLNPWLYDPTVTTGELSPFHEEMKLRFENNSNVVDWLGFDVDPTAFYDITSSYILDDGQRDDIIRLGYLNVKRGYEPCVGRMIVVYSYFEHSPGKFATVDSYVNTEYDDIPTYRNRKLSSYLDFRPASIPKPIKNRVLLRDDISIQNIEYPLNNSDIITDYRVYLPRKDLLYLTKTGFFKVAYGISAIDPLLPETPDDGMVLYELLALPHTSSSNDIVKHMIDNKRYTMRDIGNIDKRVSTLEYYTSLSLLEKSTSDMEILDVNGNDRFKNGFLVEPFDGHNIGDVIDSEYQCSIDMRTSELRPKFNEKNVNMTFNAHDSVNYVCKDDVVMLPYTHELIIDQPKCSKTVNVNPYAVFTFRGSVELKPPNDDWRDVVTNPDLKIDRDLYSTFKELADISGALGTVYGEVEEESRTTLTTVNTNVETIYRRS
jgi:hypothetical protein